MAATLASMAATLSATLASMASCYPFFSRQLLLHIPSAHLLPTHIAQGMRSIGPFVCEPFLEIVKLRNRLAKLMGYGDFYGET